MAVSLLHFSMKSSIETMTPTTNQELDQFAFELGKHLRKFSDQVAYKGFVESTVLTLANDLKKEEVFEIYNFLDKYAKQRIKEEKTHSINHFIPRDDSDQEEEDDDIIADYVDFM